MKMVINCCFGQFSLSSWAMEKLHIDEDMRYSIDRRDEHLIYLVETEPMRRVSGPCAALMVVEIPDDATDYRIVDYDGVENVYYTINGKIYMR